MKNIYKEFEKFIESQIKLNQEEDLNKSWEGWEQLFIAYKISQLHSNQNKEVKQR